MRFLEVCRRVQAPVIEDTGPPRTTWNGKVLCLAHSTDRDLWHELSHWLLAEEEFRKYLGFGLGLPFLPVGAPDEPKVSDVLGHQAVALHTLLWWITDPKCALTYAYPVFIATCHDTLFKQVSESLKLKSNGRQRAFQRLLQGGITHLGQGQYTYRIEL